MLADIRKTVTSKFVQLILGLIIIVFIFFFGGSMGGSSRQASVVAEVNGDEITAIEYNDTYLGMLRLYEQVTQKRLSPDEARAMGLPQRALDQAVDKKLLLQEADKRGIEVSDKEIADAIALQPAFRDGDVFSRELFERRLAAANLDVASYKKMEREQLTLTKLDNMVRNSVIVTPEDVEKEYRARNTKIAADYVAFDPQSFISLVEVDDQKLRDFYEAEGEAFRTMEQRAAKYAFYKVEDFLDKVEISEAQLQDEYRVRAFNFIEPESVTARHILVKVAPDAEADAWQKADERAAKLRERIEGGEEFAKVAKAESDDTATKTTGGDLGTFVRGVMTPAFENAAFTLPVGEVSQPVRTNFGYHLILVEEHKAESEKPLAEVRDELTAILKREKARDLAYRAADNSLMDLERGDVSWDKLEGSPTVATTALITSTGTDSSLPNVPNFAKTLFEMSPELPGLLIDSPEGTYIVSVGVYEPAAIPPFEAVREEVEARFRAVESAKMAKARATEFAAKAKDEGWSEALTAMGLNAKLTDTFTQAGGNIPPLGYASDAKAAITAELETGRVIAEPFDIKGAQYVFRISMITEPDMDALPLESDAISGELLPTMQDEAMKELTRNLRDGAEIEIVDDTFIR